MRRGLTFRGLVLTAGVGLTACSGPTPMPRATPSEPPDDPTPPDDGPKPARQAKIDALLAASESADVIEIKDSWAGLGRTHDVFVRLERAGDAVRWRAKVSPWAGSVGERLADPTEPAANGRTSCVCPVDRVCACERDVVERSGTTSFATIQPFLHRLSRKRVDRKQSYATGPEHTDDYPLVHIVLSGKKLAAPLHLSVRDNRWHWRANGLFVALDLPQPQPATRETPHGHLTQSYERMMARLGVLDAVTAAGTSGRGF